MRFMVETLKALQSAGKASTQVRWVGSRDGSYYLSWEEFALIAEGISYQRFSGNDIIARDLVIVGADWWLERTEVGGVQCWDLKEYPRRRGQGLGFSTIMAKRGSSLSLRRLNPKYGMGASGEA